jgi:hypothetical protein
MEWRSAQRTRWETANALAKVTNGTPAVGENDTGKEYGGLESS